MEGGKTQVLISSNFYLECPILEMKLKLYVD